MLLVPPEFIEDAKRMCGIRPEPLVFTWAKQPDWYELRSLSGKMSACQPVHPRHSVSRQSSQPNVSATQTSV